MEVILPPWVIKAIHEVMSQESKARVIYDGDPELEAALDEYIQLDQPYEYECDSLMDLEDAGLLMESLVSSRLGYVVTDWVSHLTELQQSRFRRNRERVKVVRARLRAARDRIDVP